MSDKSIQMTQRNSDNTAWDNLHPITVASNVKTAGGSDVEAQLAQMATKAEVGTLSNLNTTEKTNLVGAINELFTNANNGKTLISNVVGSPLLATDTFQQQSDKIQALKNTMATNLTNKQQESLGTEPLGDLINKITNIVTGKKWASGSILSSSSTDSFYSNTGTWPLNAVTVTGLLFKPSIILMRSSNSYWVIYDASDTTHPISALENRYYANGPVYNALSTRTIKADGTKAYVTTTGFRLPTADWTQRTYSWIAIE